MYDPSNFSKKEEEMLRVFKLQKDDAIQYFLGVIKPRLDRSYKLYIADNTDRSKEVRSWQSNIFVPYVQAVVETLKPRILDARPEFSIQGRTEDDQLKAVKLQQLIDYSWEVSAMDKESEKVVHSSMVYGTGYMQVGWKKDVRKHKFLVSADLTEKKMEWKEEERVFYDAPFCEWVDNYSLFYDWHNTDNKSKQYWFKRFVLTEAEIKRRYPSAEKRRLDMAVNTSSGDLTDYGSIRNEVKLAHTRINRGEDHQMTSYLTDGKYREDDKDKVKMFEVFEWWRPFEDSYAVMVNDVPILKSASMPNPYDFKEAPFIDIPYLRLPGEFEGHGLPMILENPQIMLNMIKNQRLDTATLNIHKMWIVNPLANINKKDLVTRPFGIIYSTDPGGVKEVQFSDIKPSSYREEELLKSDMRYASGVDDFSMGAGGEAGSATEVRHLRESTLERVRLFVNHLGDGFAVLMRYWLSMHRQFFTEDLVIRVIGDDGREMYPIIEKDDLMGEYDYKATVLPSIAGQNDVRKKQDMDLFQLLAGLPFIDPKKLTSKVLYDFNWSMDSITTNENEQVMTEEGMAAEGQGQQMSPEEMMMMEQQQGQQQQGMQGNVLDGNVPRDISDSVVSALSRKSGSQAQSPFAEAGAPINLMGASGPPPTPKGVPGVGGGAGGPGFNPRGFNMGGKINTNIPLGNNSNPEAALQRRATSIQGKNN